VRERSEKEKRKIRMGRKSSGREQRRRMILG